MRVLTLTYYCILCISALFFATEARAQCAFEGDVTIEDLATTSIPIYLSGAVNNDLSSNNCLKAVNLHFKHQFVGDLIIELVSPAGQKVTLVGPSQPISQGTTLVNGWDIQFFADSLTAVPDPTYDEVWDSQQTWFEFTLYTGKYYPHMGSLEDFNTGSVNGIWTLNVIDEVQFGNGHVYCFGLVFCDDEGLNQETCTLVEHTLTEEAVAACEGDSVLNLSIAPEFSSEFDEDIYGYGYLVFRDDEFIALETTPDLTPYEAGSYQLCGINYFNDDLSLLEGIPLGASHEEAEAYILDNGICAGFSNECMDVTIYPIPEVVEEKVSLCIGDTLVIGGEIYSETGVYDILTPSFPCDSLSILNLTVEEAIIEITTSTDSLTCDQPTLILDGSDTEYSGNAMVRWTSNNGTILTNPNSLVVEVGSEGMYTLEVDIGDCVFTEEVEIFEAKDFVTYSLSANTLTCIQDSTFIDLSVSDPIDSLFWDGPFDFSTLNEDIRVGSGGLYMVHFVTGEGCARSDTIEVKEDRQYPNLNIEGDTLSCTRLQVQLNTFPADTLGSSFQWFSDNGLLATDTFLVVQNPGLYKVEVTTAKGCVDTFSYEVISTFREIDVELISDTLDCNNSFVTVGYSSSIPNMEVLWELPNGAPVIDSSFNTSQFGTFELQLNDDLGCSLDTFLMVEIDSLLPTVVINEARFLCGDDSIQLTAEVNLEGLSYVWTKPDGNTLTDSEPYITSPGEYKLEVCKSNGCCARDTVNVEVDVTVPALAFDFQNLNCTNDTVYIIPSDTSTFLMEWSLNNNSISVDSNIIEVTQPGFYEVLVTDESNGCFSKYSFNITSDQYNKIESLNADILNCENKEVQIELSSIRTFDSFQWSGPGLLNNDLEPLVNIEGTYVIDYTFTNGCTGSDSIVIINEGELPNLQAEDAIITCKETQVPLSVSYSSSSIALSWSGPNQFSATGTSVQASEPGIYTVIGVASGFCRDTIEIELVGDTLSPQVSILNDGEITCADSTVTLIATVDANTESYTISGPDIMDPNALIFDVELPGTYTIQAVGFNGCSSMESTVVGQSTDFPVYAVNLDSLTCAIASVEVGIESPDPELAIEWDGPIDIDEDTYSFTTGIAGNYTFTLTNENGCRLKDSFFVVLDTFPPLGSVDLSSNINCFNDTVSLSITDYYDGLEVTWMGPGVMDPSTPSFSTSVVGVYHVLLRAENGCTTEDSITIVYDTLAPSIDVVGNPINCTAGKTFLRVNSDLEIGTYTWAGPGDFVSSEAEPLIFEQGVYYVEVVAINGCSSVDSIVVEDERVFPEIEVEDFYLPCDDTPESIFSSFLSDGASVRWFGPNGFIAEADTVEVIEPGTYIGFAINPEGCSASDTFLVIDEPILPEFGAFSEVLLCKGAVPITATDVEDDGSFFWNGPGDFYSENNPAMVEEPGVYQLVVYTIKGCVDTLDIEVVDGRIYPDAEADLDGPFQCSNLTINLTSEGSSEGPGYSYSWTTEDGNIVQGNTTKRPLIDKEGTYILEVNDATTGCSSFDTLVAELQPQDLMGAEVEVIQPTCLDFGNGQINVVDIIGGFGPYTIYVDDNDYGERTMIEYLLAGDHTLKIEDSLGCSIDTVINIPMDGILSVELPMDTTVYFGDTLTIAPYISLQLDSIESIVWSSNIPCDGCVSISIAPEKDLLIRLEVTDINGCIVVDEWNIKVLRPNNLPFPQIFSPNGDNVNDIFYLPMTKGLQVINYIRIYDNWGGLMYEEENVVPGDPGRGWNGHINGMDAAQAVYIVEALVTLVDGTTVPYIGDLTLIR